VTETIELGREIGEYRITGVIGRGGMATVYLAEDTSSGEEAALKVMSPSFAANESFRARFLREFRHASALDHPNVARVRDAGEDGGFLYFALDYIRGTDLKQVIALEGPLPASRALAILGQVAGALDAAHAQGILHRDVKPGNILIASGEDARPAGRCYLTDFGLSKRSAGDSIALTAPGEFVGTLQYTAPEEILGKDCDYRVDVYSLGCVLYECLTGEQPFPRERETEVLYGHVQDPAPQVTKRRPDLGPAIDDVVARAMAKDPSGRFDSCGELIAAAQAAMPEPPLRLKVTSGDATGATIDVADSFLIGRDVAGQGSFAGDQEISREHARISRRADGGYVIEDLGSTNGTFVNGNRIAGEQLLGTGDLIVVGSSTLTVAAAPQVTAVTADATPPGLTHAAPEGRAADVAQPKLALRIDVDWDAREVQLRLDDESEPVRVAYTEDGWRVVQRD
jgi:serine/threonine protein kinase